MSLSAYAVIDHETGQLIGLNASLTGAGVAALQHTTGLTMETGEVLTADLLEVAMLEDSKVLICNDGGKTVLRIERWFMGL